MPRRSEEADNSNIMTREFTVRPDEGFAHFAIMATPVGYRFLKMERKGTKAIVWYEKL